MEDSERAYRAEVARQNASSARYAQAALDRIRNNIGCARDALDNLLRTAGIEPRDIKDYAEMNGRLDASLGKIYTTIWEILAKREESAWAEEERLRKLGKKPQD
jgi:tRNA isopentenyl-2-thiomethyl-A-37 hydroxylase MiaE